MSLSTLPHMSAEDMELFFKESAAEGELNATPSEMDSCRLRRRRRSVDMMTEEDIDDRLLNGGLTEGHLQKHVTKVTILGDDTQSKLELCGLMFGKDPTTATATKQSSSSGSSARRILDVISKNVTLTADHALCDTEVWVPQVSSLHGSLRAQQFYGTHCFIFVYSIKDRRSFDNIQQKWRVEADEYINSLRDSSADEALCDVPIVLVGTDAEIRSAQLGLHAIAVPSGEAVQLAQDIGAAKYIESYSGNEHHAKEVLHQAVEATIANRSTKRYPTPIINKEHFIQHAIFMQHNRAPVPRGTFDLVQRSLAIVNEPDTTYFVTTDGTDPLGSSSAMPYTKPIEFSRPLPKFVRVAGRSRCRYPSEVVEFIVPGETPQPTGYFDTHQKTFVAKPPELPSNVGAVQLRYTLDGSDPTAKSPVYNAPLRFDGVNAVAGGPWADAKAMPPKCVKIVAIGAGMFSSRVVTLDAPAVLPQPRVQYNATDGTMSIETSAHLEYRYTLDGTTPTAASTLYLRPVMLPRDGTTIKAIRVVAFPKPAFPSAEVVVDVKQHQYRDPHQRTIHTTRTAMARSQAAAARRLDQENTIVAPPSHVAPGSRTASPVVSSRRTGSPATRQYGTPVAERTANRSVTVDTTTQRRQAMRAAAAAASGATSSPRPRAAPSARTAPAAVTPARRQPVMAPSDTQQPQQYGQHTPTSGGGPAAAPPPTQQTTATSQARSSVDCEAKDNNVNFAFNDPISLSHITVATPGGGKGPSTYEVRVQHRDSDGSMVVVGSGELEDVDAVQTMHVIPSARVIPVVRVQCAFLTSHGGLFQVNDMKIHGKPFVGGSH